MDGTGSASGGGVSTGRVRVGINPTRVGFWSVIYSSYAATAALGGAAPDLRRFAIPPVADWVVCSRYHGKIARYHGKIARYHGNIARYHNII